MGTAFGDRLKRVRLARGYTRRQLGRRALSDQSVIWALEAGIRNPRGDSVSLLAWALGVRAEDLGAGIVRHRSEPDGRSPRAARAQDGAAEPFK